MTRKIAAMNKFLFVFCLLCLSSIQLSCLKNITNSDSKPPEYDAVVGNYLAMNVPPGWISGSVSISKTASSKYKLTPGTASIPSFNFQHDPIGSFFVNGFSYLVPKQTSNTVVLDSTYLTLYTGANTISVTLTSGTSGTSWRYDGVKQR